MDAATAEVAIRDFFGQFPSGAAAVYLFGSVARGDAGPDSDIDVGVLFAVAPPATLRGQPFDLADALARVLGRPVDLVTLNSATADLRIRVLREGRLVVDVDPSARIRFEVRTRNEFWDIEPRLHEYRRERRSA